MQGSHSASNMANILVKVLNMYIKVAINYITAVNGTIINGIFLDLQLELKEWSQENGQIWCLAHVLNIAP